MRNKFEKKLNSLDLSEYKNIEGIDVLRNIFTGEYDLIGYNYEDPGIGICKPQIEEDQLENILKEIDIELAQSERVDV